MAGGVYGPPTPNPKQSYQVSYIYVTPDPQRSAVHATPPGCHDELSGEHAMEVAARMAAWMLKKAAEWTAAKEAGGKKATGGSDGGDDLRRRVD